MNLPTMSGVTGQVYEEYKVNDDTHFHVFSTTNWYAQTFKPSVTHDINQVRIKAFREGAPGQITVSIRATTAGKPSGADIVSGTRDADDFTTVSPGEWYEINIVPTTLTAGVTYAIVIRTAGADTNNDVLWRTDVTSPAYADGSAYVSSDTGATWTIQGADNMFEELEI